MGHARWVVVGERNKNGEEEEEELVGNDKDRVVNIGNCGVKT